MEEEWREGSGEEGEGGGSGRQVEGGLGRWWKEEVRGGGGGRSRDSHVQLTFTVAVVEITT